MKHAKKGRERRQKGVEGNTQNKQDVKEWGMENRGRKELETKGMNE